MSGSESGIFGCDDKQLLIRYHPETLRGYVVTMDHGLNLLYMQYFLGNHSVYTQDYLSLFTFSLIFGAVVALAPINK
jgi:hypothetical protein